MAPPPSSTSAAMWRDAAPLADACRTHPFVTGLADGSLPLTAFQHYIAQDAWFLEAFARAYALCLAKAPDGATMRTLKALLDGAMEELALHEGYAARWQAPLATEPTAATRAYTDFLLNVAALEPLAHAVAAMTPCMRLYAWLGQQLAEDHDPGSDYAEWVATYADPGFEDLAAALEALLDGLLDRGAGDAGAVAARYATAMRLELAFFDSPLDAVAASP